MVDKVSSELSLAARRCRFALWILLLLLTAAILLFPTHLRYEYHAVESLYIFGDRLILFGVLYSVWMAALLALLFLFRSRRDEWEKLALLCVFTIVFVSFWVLITPLGRYADEVDNLAHVKYLQDVAEVLPDHPNFGYFSFPGIHLTGLALTQVCGLGIFEAKTLFLVFISLLSTVLLYLLCLKSLGSPRLASLAVLIMLQGNMLLCRQPTFWPGALSLVFLFVLLILLNKRVEAPFGAIANRLLIVIAFAALTITYLPTPVCLIFILLGVFVVQRIGRKSLLDWSIITLPVVMVLAWETYWATRMFEGLVGWGESFVKDLTWQGLAEHLLFLRVTGIYLGEYPPLWASLTRSFWLLVTYVVGGILAVVNLTRVRKLGLTETMETAALLGIIVFYLIVQLLAPGGSQYHRLLMYAHIFTVPIALGFLSKWFQPSRLRHLGLALGLVLLLVLAFPTFLAHHDQVSTYKVYRYEYADGEFLSSIYGKGEGLLVYTADITVCALRHSMPEARYAGRSPYEVLADEDDFWRAMNKVVTGFENYKGTKVFVYSEKFTFAGQRVFAIEPTDPKWAEMEHRLEENFNKIYDNGHSKIFR